MNNYVGGKEASELIGVHQRTLYQWDKKNKIETIRTPGGKRLYNVDKFIKESKCSNDEKCLENLNNLDKINGKINICYARVSSMGQKDNLQRQKKTLTDKYPDYTLIEDIGSGVNLNKRGLRKIIKLAIEGKLNRLVIVHKDRLTRFGYELIEDLIKEYSDGKIIIIEKKDDMEPEEELVYDVLQIMNVFVAKMNGLRKYNKNK
jgi:putative resolvase